jgi:predicted transcriptional regulator
MTTHVLISLEERHANNILAGTKTVELRRRSMHVEPGTLVWFYVKQPVACVVGFAVAGERYAAAPDNVWRKFGKVSGLERKEFMDYFDGCSEASAMRLDAPTRLRKYVGLAELRANVPGFHPPQFYVRMNDESPLRNLLTSYLTKRQMAMRTGRRLLS